MPAVSNALTEGQIHSATSPPPHDVCTQGLRARFLTLADDTEAFYLVDEFCAPQYERGIRWNDPRFAMQWPAQPAVISEKDCNYRDFDPAWHITA